MHFALTEEQAELASTVRSLLASRADSTAVRTAMSDADGFDRSLWRTMCDQVGVAALAVPEQHDGAGASLVETALVLEEVGRSLAPSPLLAHAIAIAAVLLHGSADQRGSLLPRLAGGEIGTVAWDAPAAGLVLDGPAAELVLGFDDGRLVERDLPVERVRALDPTLLLGAADTGRAPDDLRDVAMALATASMVGVMQRGLEMTVGHAREREQFGRPIGSFQALKHRMADMLVLVEASRSASWAASAAAAAYVLDRGEEARATLRRRAAVAQAWCSEAVQQVAAETIQLHGGIAITWEHDAQLVLKRAHTLAQLFGQAHRHRAALLRTPPRPAAPKSECAGGEPDLACGGMDQHDPAPLAFDRAGPPGDVPVVLVHAGIADRRMWDPQWAPLTARRDAVRIDLRGFGDSTTAPDGAIAHVDDLAATLDALAIERCHVVGASLGAGVAVELALTRPELVASLLLAPPGGSLLVEMTPDLRAFIDAETEALDRDDLDAAADANVSAWVVGPGRTHADVAPEVIAEVHRMQRQVFEIQEPWGDVEETELEPPAAERLGEVAVPTLVVIGGHDLGTTREAAGRLSRQVPGARLVEWADVAHLPSMERPGDFLALLLEWVARDH